MVSVFPVFLLSISITFYQLKLFAFRKYTSPQIFRFNNIACRQVSMQLIFLVILSTSIIASPLVFKPSYSWFFCMG